MPRRAASILTRITGARSARGGHAGGCERRIVVVGNPRLFAEAGIDTAVREDVERLEAAAKTVMLATVDGELAGIIAVADTVKPTLPMRCARCTAWACRS